MDKPRKTHLIITMRILKYVKGIKNFGVKYENENEPKLIRYSDSD